MERIYPRLRPILVARAFRQLSNETRAADVADETLTRVLRLVIEERSKFEDSRHLTRYLLVTLASRIVDRRRHDTRYQEPVAESDDATDRFERMVASETDGADVSDQERDELIRKALNALSPLDRVAVELSYLKELSSEEAGITMGVSPMAFRTRLSRAMQTLRKWGTQWRLI